MTRCGQLNGDSAFISRCSVWYIHLAAFDQQWAMTMQQLQSHNSYTVACDKQQVATVMTAKGRITAASYWIRLRASTAYQIFPILILYNGQGYVSQNCTLSWGIQAPHNIWFLESARDYIPSGTLICSSVFVELTFVPDPDRDIQTMLQW